MDWIDEFLVRDNDSLYWNLYFRRHPQNWEIHQIIQLLQTLDTLKLANGKDRVVWSLENSCECSVKSLHSHLVRIGTANQGSNTNQFRSVWDEEVPSINGMSS